MTFTNQTHLFDLKGLRTQYPDKWLKCGELVALDPDVYPKFLTHLSKTVKRDPVTKHLAILTGLSAYTPDPINLFLRGDSSIGKTYNMVQALRYFPKEDVMLLGGLSTKALIHDYGVLMSKNGEEVDFTQKPGKDATPEKREAWKKQLDGSYCLIDLQKRILVFLEAPHIETFNYLRPVLSHDVFEIHYKITDKTSRGQLQTKHVVLRGFPSAIFCTTQEKYVQDLATRSFTITPETTEEKYHDANILSGCKAALPFSFEDDFDFMLLQGFIGYLRNHLEEMKALIPFGSEFAKSFPSKHARSMRDFQHILSLIRVYALFHFAQRPILVRKIKTQIASANSLTPQYRESEEKYVMASREDFDFVSGLWREIRETTETAASSNIIRFFHAVVEEIAQVTPEFSIGDLTDKWNEKFTDHKSSDSIRKWIDFLCEIGYVTKEPDPTDKRQNRIKIIEENKNGKYTQNSLSEIFGLDSLKAWLNEAKGISEENSFSLRIDFVSEAEATPEEIFSRYYADSLRHENGNSSDIALPDSKPSLTKSATKKADKTEIVQFLNCKLEDLVSVYWSDGFYDEHTCGVCGSVKPTSWEAETTKGVTTPICEECVKQFDEKRKVV